MQMSLAYFQAMAAQDIIGRIAGVYLPSLAFEAIGEVPSLHSAGLNLNISWLMANGHLNFGRVVLYNWVRSLHQASV